MKSKKDSKKAEANKKFMKKVYLATGAAIIAASFGFIVLQATKK